MWLNPAPVLLIPLWVAREWAAPEAVWAARQAVAVMAAETVVETAAAQDRVIHKRAGQCERSFYVSFVERSERC